MMAMPHEILRVGGLRLCGMWGNERLAVASVNAAYEAKTTRSESCAAVLRKLSYHWRLLVAARNPSRTRIRKGPAGGDSHQPLRARSGSVLVARHAGTKQATRDATAITANADPNAIGSRGLTSYKR
jgi:hypothetical protein